jgi:hypothetical protein
LRYQESLSDLRPVIYHDIISTGEILESSSEWNALTPLQKKERSRNLFTTVLIRGTRLLAAKLTDACYALIQLSVDVRQPHPRGCCNHGSDGPCTRCDKIALLPPDEVPPDWDLK